MFKFIGAVVFGLLTMGAAAYFVARPAEQRTNDFSTGKKLIESAINSIKTYFHSLFAPQETAAV